MSEYELYQRDGHSKHMVLKCDSLEELAEAVAEKAGRPALADGGREDG
ncbi:hypothetical protein [Halobellus sp. Atlit-38R]|nr:hypothetical protein [Halobellus sp. Atlit-38R]